MKDLKKINDEYSNLTAAKFDKKAADKFQSVFDSIFEKENAVKLIVEPGSGQILKANKTACSFYGFDPEEIKKKKITEINKLSEEEVVIEYKRQKKEGRDYFINKQLVASGKTLKVEVRSASVYLNNKKCFYFLIHEIENEKKSGHLDLYNQMTGETSVELLDENKLMISEGLELIEKNARDLIILTSKLAESEAKLRELNASKDRFFSIISHDIKNHFASILGLSRLLTKEVYNDDFQKRIEISTNLHDSSKKLYSLLENLLEWAKLQRDEIKISPDEFNLYDVCKEVTDLISLFAEEKNIEMTNDIDEKIKVYADKNMIKTVLRNLLVNAVNFTHKEGVIKLDANLEGGRVFVSVSDSGVGIEEKNINKLFRIDQKFINRSTDGYKGTGLGLILCKEFVEKNNGNIWVESKPGKGSVFTFSVPISNNPIIEKKPPRNIIDFPRLN